jgi:hypothetical protein
MRLPALSPLGERVDRVPNALDRDAGRAFARRRVMGARDAQGATARRRVRRSLIFRRVFMGLRPTRANESPLPEPRNEKWSYLAQKKQVVYFPST